jgi:plastocyanin
MRKLLALGLLLLAVAALAGCSGADAKVSGAVQSGQVTVELKNMKFSPAKLTVKAGTKVTFVNKDVLQHDVIQVAAKDYGKATPGFSSPVLDPGQAFTATFDKPGEYPVICTQSAHFTAGMTATVTVVP